jgi:hypothetical protein
LDAPERGHVPAERRDLLAGRGLIAHELHDAARIRREHRQTARCTPVLIDAQIRAQRAQCVGRRRPDDGLDEILIDSERRGGKADGTAVDQPGERTG